MPILGHWRDGKNAAHILATEGPQSHCMRCAEKRRSNVGKVAAYQMRGMARKMLLNHFLHEGQGFALQVTTLGDKQVDLEIGIGGVLHASEAHSAELVVFGQDNLREFVGADNIGDAPDADNPAAVLRIAEFANPVGVPGKVSDANSKADRQGFAGPLPEDFVGIFRCDEVGAQL